MTYRLGCIWNRVYLWEIIRKGVIRLQRKGLWYSRVTCMHQVQGWEVGNMTKIYDYF